MWVPQSCANDSPETLHARFTAGLVNLALARGLVFEPTIYEQLMNNYRATCHSLADESSYLPQGSLTQRFRELEAELSSSTRDPVAIYADQAEVATLLKNKERAVAQYRRQLPFLTSIPTYHEWLVVAGPLLLAAHDAICLARRLSSATTATATASHNPYERTMTTTTNTNTTTTKKGTAMDSRATTTTPTFAGLLTSLSRSSKPKTTTRHPPRAPSVLPDPAHTLGLTTPTATTQTTPSPTPTATPTSTPQHNITIDPRVAPVVARLTADTGASLVQNVLSIPMPAHTYCDSSRQYHPRDPNPISLPLRATTTATATATAGVRPPSVNRHDSEEDDAIDPAPSSRPLSPSSPAPAQAAPITPIHAGAVARVQIKTGSDGGIIRSPIGFIYDSDIHGTPIRGPVLFAPGATPRALDVTTRARALLSDDDGVVIDAARPVQVPVPTGGLSDAVDAGRADNMPREESPEKDETAVAPVPYRSRSVSPSPEAHTQTPTQSQFQATPMPVMLHRVPRGFDLGLPSPEPDHEEVRARAAPTPGCYPTHSTGSPRSPRSPTSTPTPTPTPIPVSNGALTPTLLQPENVVGETPPISSDPRDSFDYGLGSASTAPRPRSNPHLRQGAVPCTPRRLLTPTNTVSTNTPPRSMAATREVLVPVAARRTEARTAAALLADDETPPETATIISHARSRCLEEVEHNLIDPVATSPDPEVDLAPRPPNAGDRTVVDADVDVGTDAKGDSPVPERSDAAPDVPPGIFVTAGGGRPWTISAAAQARGSIILAALGDDDEDDNDAARRSEEKRMRGIEHGKTVKQLSEAEPASEPNRGATETGSAHRQHQPHQQLSAGGPLPEDIGSLFTTGSGRPVVISEAGQARARALLADLTDDHPVPTEGLASVTAPSTATTATVTATVAPTHVPEAIGSLFTTGSGRPVVISEAGQARARALLADITDGDQAPPAAQVPTDDTRHERSCPPCALVTTTLGQENRAPSAPSPSRPRDPPRGPSSVGLVRSLVSPTPFRSPQVVVAKTPSAPPSTARGGLGRSRGRGTRAFVSPLPPGRVGVRGAHTPGATASASASHPSTAPTPTPTIHDCYASRPAGTLTLTEFLTAASNVPRTRGPRNDRTCPWPVRYSDARRFVFPGGRGGAFFADQLRARGARVHGSTNSPNNTTTTRAAPMTPDMVWILHHVALIVWRLALRECVAWGTPHGSSDQNPTPTWLTELNVLNRLAYRWERERVRGHQPALRRILQGDLGPGLPLILQICDVSDLSSPSSNGADTGTATATNPMGTTVWVTDGWYVIRADLDAELARDVARGHGLVGQKWHVVGAELILPSGPGDPLESPLGHNALRLHANGTRRAPADAPLGLAVSPEHAIRVRPLSRLVPGGGVVPATVAVVRAVAPLSFHERGSEGRPGIYRAVAAEEEAARQWRDEYEAATIRAQQLLHVEGSAIGGAEEEKAVRKQAKLLRATRGIPEEREVSAVLTVELLPVERVVVLNGSDRNPNPNHKPNELKARLTDGADTTTLATTTTHNNNSSSDMVPIPVPVRRRGLSRPGEPARSRDATDVSRIAASIASIFGEDPTSSTARAAHAELARVRSGKAGPTVPPFKPVVPLVGGEYGRGSARGTRGTTRGADGGGAIVDVSHLRPPTCTAGVTTSTTGNNTPTTTTTTTTSTSSSSTATGRTISLQMWRPEERDLDTLEPGTMILLTGVSVASGGKDPTSPLRLITNRLTKIIPLPCPPTHPDLNPGTCGELRHAYAPTVEVHASRLTVGSRVHYLGFTICVGPLQTDPSDPRGSSTRQTVYLVDDEHEHEHEHDHKHHDDHDDTRVGVEMKGQKKKQKKESDSVVPANASASNPHPHPHPDPVGYTPPRTRTLVVVQISGEQGRPGGAGCDPALVKRCVRFSELEVHAVRFSRGWRVVTCHTTLTSTAIEVRPGIGGGGAGAVGRKRLREGSFAIIPGPRLGPGHGRGMGVPCGAERATRLVTWAASTTGEHVIRGATEQIKRQLGLS